MALSHQLNKNFDVFLSFRGEDARRGFVRRLYEALTQHGIQTFIDDNLHRGENISEELLKVIENARASIIVFSKNYASSSWCLDELAKMIECTKKVLPVFYQVDPSEVLKQKGDFGKALTKLEKKIKDKTKVQRWREALSKAANMSGWHYNDSRTESELVEKIVEEILNSDFIWMPSNYATMQQLVGINSRIEAVTKLLDIKSNDVRMVGITGLGGIGKTTIAKAIYNSSFSNHFKAKSFVENVRKGWSKTEEGKIRLQRTLLKGISEDKNLSVDNLNEGSTMINKILRLKKVLIILDDVDNADQIDTLLGCKCFAFGSRIILTTRNKSLLVNGNGFSASYYEVEELHEDEAIELFRMHAFPSNEVPEDYLELEKQAISYAKGLPLALKVMGRDLCEKPTDYWEDALDCYKTNPHEDIQNILKRSYDGLTEKEKNIFLDIACFFKEYDMRFNMIKDVLKACRLNPAYGIRNLIDKCLLTIDEDDYYLSMHDLLQQMGMDIVRQEAPQKPGERSRLWCYEEALEVLTEDMGSNKIQSMILLPPKSEPVEVQIKAQFCKMKNLRLLLIHNVRCCNGPPECLPNGLSLLDWRDYPFSSRPPKFFPKKLVVLNSPLILLKEPVLKQKFVSVTHVDLSYCDLITIIPDLSMTPNVKELILSHCRNLIEIDDSVGRLDKLEAWYMRDCGKLETLPNCLTMKSLTHFSLHRSGRRIKKFPNILHEMKGVEELTLPDNCIELPPSFGNLIGLKELTVGSAYHLGEAHLSDSIFLKNVEIDRQPMCNSLGCSYVFPMLKKLSIYCNKIYSDTEFILNCFSPHTLEELVIYYSKVVTLPESMSRCERLHTLYISCCDELREIPRLPERLHTLTIRGCDELREILRLPHSIRRVDVSYCHSLGLQSFSQLLREIIGLPPNLPPCLGVTRHMSSLIWFPEMKERQDWLDSLCEYSFEVTGDENDIPNWFNHQRDGNLLSFTIGPEFPTIAVCTAFGIQDSYCELCHDGDCTPFEKQDCEAFHGFDRSFDYHVIISINGTERRFERKSIGKDKRSGHLTFSCRPQSSLQELFRDLQLKDRNHVEILCETVPYCSGDAYPPPQRIGVHVECNCPPPQNPSIIQDIEFILNCFSPHPLEELVIYDSKVVTLPESMSRCERLHTLFIRGCDELREILRLPERLHTLIIGDCDELREIPRLPHSIRRVEVTSCHSLDLQSFFQLLREIIGLPPNLPPCLGVTRHMIMFPHSSTMLPICHNCPCEYSFEVTGDENDIPNWFNHQRDENLISFSIGPEFPTIALCIAFGMQDSRCNFDYHVIISINGSERMFGRNSIEKDRNFGHLSFSCRRQSSLQELFRNLQLTDRNHVEIHCETFHIFQEIAPIVKRIGVHVECNCPRQNPSIFQDINRHLSLQSGQVLSSPVIKKSKEISETEEGGECEDETDADIETTLKAEGITPEQDESNGEDPSPSLLSVEKCLLTLTQGAGESSSSTSQDSVECSLPMSQTPNSRNEADVLTNTWSNQDGVQDLSFESIKVSEISELMDFPSRVLSLKIEEFNDLEFIPQGEVLSSPVIKKSKEISETEERGECEDDTDADIEATLKAKVITPEQDESNEEDPSPSLFLEEKSSLPPTQGAGESSLPMSQTPNSRNEADVLTDTWSNQDGVQDLSFESIKVSEISELMDLPTRVHSLKIEGCDDLEFIPKGVMSSELSLQDLYIINCCSLKSFPKDHPPTALKILYIRNCKKLNFPLTTEKKTHQDALLEYLCIGSSCDSLKSISLDLFPNLKSLSVWDCANLESLSMPVQKNLTSLEALEIRDCPKLVSFLGGGLCTMNLMSIWLSNCKKLEKLPELHTLGSLQSMFINNCPELESLSEKGLPSRLSLLSITFCNKLKLKDEWGLDGLAYLRRLEIEGGCVDVGSFPEKFLPSNLSSLRISGLLNVKNLDNKGFQQLTALQRLEISCCPNLQSLPEDGFPSSLSSLCIKECPLLTSKFRNKKGKDWSKIDHISCIEIDEEVIS